MKVSGTRLPGGTFRITADENQLLCRSVGTKPAASGTAHPIFYYIATQVGMGLTVADLLKLCDFDVADGPLMTASNVTFNRELRVDETYRVEGEIVSLVRKPSRTFGAVDLLDFRLRLIGQDGKQDLECTNQWVLPRREKQP